MTFNGWLQIGFFALLVLLAHEAARRSTFTASSRAATAPAAPARAGRALRFRLCGVDRTGAGLEGVRGLGARLQRPGVLVTYSS